MQSMARKNEWPLDRMCLSVEVTKKNREDMTAPPREGSYVHGLFMEGNLAYHVRQRCSHSTADKTVSPLSYSTVGKLSISSVLFL